MVFGSFVASTDVHSRRNNGNSFLNIDVPLQSDASSVPLVTGMHQQFLGQFVKTVYSNASALMDIDYIPSLIYFLKEWRTFGKFV